jgi:5-methylcytosine-specific restriction endonuclease McrA
MNTCIYCNGEAIFQFTNGKWCCASNMNRCPEMRKRRSLETKQSWQSKTRGQAGTTKQARKCRNTILTQEEQDRIVKEFQKGASVNHMRDTTGRGVTILKKLLQQSGIVYDPEKAKCKLNRMECTTPTLFKKDSITSNHSLKRIIKQFNLIPHTKCWECGLSEWLKGDLILELDHIDGNNTNNEISNLRFLCPNCHSQTNTFRGRSINTGKKRVSDQELIESLEKFPNIRQALKNVGLSPRGANYTRAYTLRNMIKTQNILAPSKETT